MCPEFVKSLFCQITPRSRSNAIYHRPDQMLTQSAMENNPEDGLDPLYGIQWFLMTSKQLMI